jgi:hypothetical protein
MGRYGHALVFTICMEVLFGPSGQRVERPMRGLVVLFGFLVWSVGVAMLFVFMDADAAKSDPSNASDAVASNAAPELRRPVIRSTLKRADLR